MNFLKKRMVRLILVFVIASTGLAGGRAYAGPVAKLAQSTVPQDLDMLLSTPCLLARDELERITTAAHEHPQPDRSELERARKHVAQACLGAAGAQPKPNRARYPPVAVPLVRPAEPRLAATPAPLPSVLSPRVFVITACDPGGCWDSEGVRLQRSGTSLTGPRGECVLEGDLFKCP